MLFSIFSIDYENVDCDLATSITIGNRTTISWPLPEMYVDTYEISVLTIPEGETMIEIAMKDFTETNNSVDVFGLQYNTVYDFIH